MRERRKGDDGGGHGGWVLSCADCGECFDYSQYMAARLIFFERENPNRRTPKKKKTRQKSTILHHLPSVSHASPTFPCAPLPLVLMLSPA